MAKFEYLFFLFFFFERLSFSPGWPQALYVAKEDIKLIFLILLSKNSRVTVVYYEAQFMLYWGLNPRLCACCVNALLTVSLHRLFICNVLISGLDLEFKKCISELIF